MADVIRGHDECALRWFGKSDDLHPGTHRQQGAQRADDQTVENKVENRGAQIAGEINGSPGSAPHGISAGWLIP